MTPEAIEARCMPEPNSGCWLWLMCVDRLGYGKISMDGARTLAHRASWVAFRGPIPAGLVVCHKCDVPGCVNPAHLFVGTHRDNVMDKVRKGRGHSRALRGSENTMTKLDEAKVANILRDERPVRLIAKEYGVKNGVIHNIKSRLTWRHVSP